MSYRTDSNRVQGKQPQTRGVSFRKVTYGGVDGTYYTATKTRKTGSDGVSYFQHFIVLVIVSFVCILLLKKRKRKGFVV